MEFRLLFLLALLPGALAECNPVGNTKLGTCEGWCESGPDQYLADIDNCIHEGCDTCTSVQNALHRPDAEVLTAPQDLIDTPGLTAQPGLRIMGFFE